MDLNVLVQLRHEIFFGTKYVQKVIDNLNARFFCVYFFAYFQCHKII